MFALLVAWRQNCFFTRKQVVPVMYVFFTLFSVIGGAVLFREFHTKDTVKNAVFLLG